MSKILYCWRCETEVPMLEEHEWELVAPHLSNAVQQIKNYLETHQSTFAEARQKGYGQEALALYKSITGVDAIHPDVLWHHRLKLFGPPCYVCGKPLRTPQAKICMFCGAKRNNE
jgi:hypothetical protein